MPLKSNLPQEDLECILNIEKYPRKLSNPDLYNITGEDPRTEKVKRRQLSFFGHVS